MHSVVSLMWYRYRQSGSLPIYLPSVYPLHDIDSCAICSWEPRSSTISSMIDQYFYQFLWSLRSNSYTFIFFLSFFLLFISNRIPIEGGCRGRLVSQGGGERQQGTGRAVWARRTPTLCWVGACSLFSYNFRRLLMCPA